MNQGDWVCLQKDDVGKVIEVETLWGETTCRVWLPGRDCVVRVPVTRLKPLESSGANSPDKIAYIAAAARVADALTQDLSACDAQAGVLLAPIESSVIPLPHQICALSRAIAGDRVRYLLADEVGLGKTIEAGLILRELKLRGLVRRTLVIAPKGLVSQWQAEMRTHFGETLQLVLPEDIKTLKRIAPANVNKGNNDPGEVSANAWRMFSQVVVPMDSFKPLEKRRGWSAAQVGEYNRERFEDLISAGWDLVIVDEAHRLGGSTDQVARFKLGQGLAEAAPYFLLLSATPHQGKTDAFQRLLSLLDPREFQDISSVTRERVRPYVIRTEKRRAIDAEGKPLFKPRRTQLTPVSWDERHRSQQLLYEAVTEYVREGYNQAIREKRSYIGFLMILMQRLVVSSTSAIKSTLKRRLEILASESNVPNLIEELQTLDIRSETFYDQDGQEQVDMLLRTRLKALKNERAEVKLLLETANRCEQVGPDAKAEALLDCLYRLQSEEGDPELKALVFTEFIPTQEMLRRFLTERGFSVVCLNGSMDMEERKEAQECFARDARILISTDAGGEGLNLQFCHVVINYDIPWNPMRLEQRIGRVDRIGQSHTVRAVNFVFEGSVEHRVREVLEQKLAVIFEEFGIDKTGDVLDSAQAGQMFDEMYVEAILNPENVEESVKNVVTRLQEQARAARTTAAVLGATEALDPGQAQRLLTHPLSHWVERMTVSYLKAHGGQAERKGQSWTLTWPDGKTHENVVFTVKEAERLPAARHLTLEEPKVRVLAVRLPRFVPGQPVPSVSIPGISAEVKGLWSLWQISVVIHEFRAASRWDGPVTLDLGPENRRRRIMPLFLADNGMVYKPTARHVWDQLLAESALVRFVLEAPFSQDSFAKLRYVAEEHGRPIYGALVHEHRARIAREREKADYAFAARRRTTGRIGLPQVKNFRLSLLAQEERNFQEQLDQQAHAYPEMAPLLILRVEGGSHD
ncbi:MAG: RNA polymerase-associated protein RapA [Syntrophomonadaceae bacterium]|nr:RNA polymerase-associated protein RapA [Bacillota bacterium]